jgi:hypothetical protein
VKNIQSVKKFNVWSEVHEKCTTGIMRGLDYKLLLHKWIICEIQPIRQYSVAFVSEIAGQPFDRLK